MSNATATASASAETFASGRYSKRKRIQVTYNTEDTDVSDEESDFESLQVKKKRKSKSTTSSSADKPLPKRKTFPFLLLPAEIRNIIYDYTLADPLGINLMGTIHNRRRQTVRISAALQKKTSRGPYYYTSTSDASTSADADDEEPAPLVPALLAVCKQIHREAKDVLYGNDFIFADSFALYAFMINLGPSGARHVKNITIRGWLDGRATKGYNHSCFAALLHAVNLTSFTIDTPSSYHRAAKRLAHQLYRDAFPWLEAVAAANGKVDAALDVLRLGESFFRYAPWMRQPSRSTDRDEKSEMNKQFRAELRRLLGGQQMRVMASAPRRVRKGAGSVKVDEEEHA